ncbi:SRPBCC family protein [Nocardiopsis sp. NPDC058631]|uniref:SRPBCC family protein n=1 Tax=Nocardiopsis sp. NPDC058631 TaxID=3346566 RepID=UPI0036552FB3
MRISNEFTVNAPVERVWHLLTDVEAVAPCVPGVRLTGVDGPLYSGAVRVKVGSVVAAYSGTARFTELDEKERRAVLVASGRASRGSGSASATVTARLRAEGGRTAVGVETDLTVTGRLSELGVDAISRVSASLTARFAKALEEEYGLAPYRTGGAGAAEGTGPERSTVEDSPRAGAPETGGSGGTDTVGETHGANGAFRGHSGKNDDKIPEKITENKKGPDQAEHPKYPSSPTPAGEDGPLENPPVSDITGGVTGTQSFPDHADLAPATAPGGVIADRVWPLLAILVVAGGMILGYALFS